VTLHPDLFVGRDLNFLAIFLHRLMGLEQFGLKFWAEIRMGFRGSCKLNTKGYEKMAFSTNISLYFENGTTYSHGSLLVCALSKDAISDEPE